MRTIGSWKGGGCLPPATFMLTLISTLLSADGETRPCNKCNFNENGYRGPTWAYPCMAGYSGPKKENIKCEGQDSCFRQLMINGKEVHGSGGCFDSTKKGRIEEVTKVKFDDGTGCIPEITVDPLITKDLKEKCGLVAPDNSQDAPGRRRKRDAAASEPKGYVCVCHGSGCNNIGGRGPRSAEEQSGTPRSSSMNRISILIGLVVTALIGLGGYVKF